MLSASMRQFLLIKCAARFGSGGIVANKVLRGIGCLMLYDDDNGHRAVLRHRRHPTLAVCASRDYSSADGYSFTRNLDVKRDDKTTGVQVDDNEDFEPRRLEEVLLRIAKWLDCSYDEATEILRRVPQLRGSHLETMDNYVQFLEQNGIGAKILHENYWLLAESVSNVRSKLRLVVRKLGDNRLVTREMVPLLRFRWQAIKKLMASGEYANVGERVDFLARNLNVPRQEVASKLLTDKHKHLLTMDYFKLIRVMELLLESSVSPVDIAKDLWVFKHNEQLMNSRLKIAIEAGAKSIKPWIFRCTEASFQKYLERVKLSEKIAGGDNLEHRIDYFSRRLGKRDGHTKAEHYPVVKRISVIKMKSAFDAIYELGCTPDQIYNYPTVLGLNVAKLESKLRLVKSCFPIDRLPMHIICFRQDKFERALRRICTLNERT